MAYSTRDRSQPQKHRFEFDSETSPSNRPTFGSVSSANSPQPKRLKIATDDLEPTSPTEDSPNSLFDDTSPTSAVSPYLGCAGTMTPALLHAPPIPGLFFTPSLLLSVELANQVTQFCMNNYFNRPGVNQIMLFGVASSSSGLPPILQTLLSTISSLLEPSLPSEIHALLFPHTPTRARQAILNLYNPGEGITPHVDLLRRFGDGIVGVSLGSSCAMQFARADLGETAEEPPVQLFLPERSMIVFSGDARYAWTHGIEGRTADVVDDEDEGGGAHRVVRRGVRLSVTFRWLLPGADVVGDDET